MATTDEDRFRMSANSFARLFSMCEEAVVRDEANSDSSHPVLDSTSSFPSTPRVPVSDSHSLSDTSDSKTTVPRYTAYSPIQEELMNRAGYLNYCRYRKSKPQLEPCVSHDLSSLPLPEYGSAGIEKQVFKSKYFCDYLEVDQFVEYSKLGALDQKPSHSADWSSPTVEVKSMRGLPRDDDQARHLASALTVEKSEEESVLELLTTDVFSQTSGDSKAIKDESLHENYSPERNDIPEESKKQLAKEFGQSTMPQQKKQKKVSQPKYALRTRTDTDILDDGYKWRKYGQKAVKNSPHPRSYYRCTYNKCSVKKRVERFAEDSGIVVTTYQGVHSHHCPANADEQMMSYPRLVHLYPLVQPGFMLPQLPQEHSFLNS